MWRVLLEPVALCTLPRTKLCISSDYFANCALCVTPLTLWICILRPSGCLLAPQPGCRS